MNALVNYAMAKRYREMKSQLRKGAKMSRQVATPPRGFGNTAVRRDVMIFDSIYKRIVVRLSVNERCNEFVKEERQRERRKEREELRNVSPSSSVPVIYYFLPHKSK